MPTLLVLRGLPASGKSTFAHELVANSLGQWKRINNDTLRLMLDAEKFSKSNEKFLRKVRKQAILLALEEGFSVVVDNTNLSQSAMQELQDIILEANNFNSKQEVKLEINDSFLKTSIIECIRRDALRPKPVGAKVIWSMARENKIPAYTPIEKYSRPDLPKCVIFDMDGTLALMGDRNPFDASTSDQDAVNEPVMELLNLHVQITGHKVFIFSGREEKYRTQTALWLVKNFSAQWEQFVQLEMRPTGDQRKDFLVKSDMFDKNVRGQYDVQCCIDDRDQIVNFYRHELGLNVFQVNEGSF